MKRLVAVSDIKDLAGTGKKALYVEPGTIITPAARDAANEMGISISFGQEPEQVAPEAAPVKDLPESQPET
ncbi:MAG: ethanolamine utilization protein EutQ, partial [Clostridia bacterium]|nr:ethanolamine utilization protein EutQ [Clostridia bacterium]